MTAPKLFVASTGQHVGKTTISLGLIDLFSKAFGSSCFLKPIGQEQRQLKKNLLVDKDVLLFASHFNKISLASEMSPITIPPGFTRAYLDGKITKEQLTKKILTCYHHLQKLHSSLIIEGTGHLGVGSILDLNNAQVAELLGAPIILVCEGGLGSSFDELALNLALCEKYRAKLIGIILNKVKKDKEQMIRSYMTKALKKKIPLFGCIPFNPLLSAPTMRDLEHLFETSLLSGYEFSLEHYENLRVLTTSLQQVKECFNTSQIIITSSRRNEVLLSILDTYEDMQQQKEKPPSIGLVLTGNEPPIQEVLDRLQKAHLPAIYVQKTTQAILKALHQFHAKIEAEDKAKINQAIAIVKEHIDFKALTQAMDI